MTKRTATTTIIFIAIFTLLSVKPAFAFLPTDPYYYTEQWYLQKVMAPQAWDFTWGSSEVVVAVLDSGIDLYHPDLKDNLWINRAEILGDGLDNDNNGYIDDYYGWDFVDNDNSPEPSLIHPDYNEAGVNHGTIVAGIIAAKGNNGQGIAGVTWNSKIMPLRILDSLGSGDVVSAIKAIDYAVQNGADIINMSFVGSDYSEAMHKAIKRAWEKGIVLVSAAGNDSVEQGYDLDNYPEYPVCYDGDENMVIGVAALDKNNKKTIFSNYSRSYVDISAPGASFFSTNFYSPKNTDFNKYYGGYWSGTSVAAPLISGTAALIKSLNPNFSNKKIQEIIIASADDLDPLNPDLSGKLGRGLNIYKALDLAYKQLSEADLKKNIITGAGAGGGPHVRIFNSNGLAVGSFFAYKENFSGGVNVASGDLDGDGRDEIITGAGAGGGPHVRIFNSNGLAVGSFFAYKENFSGGVNVASGDLDGDGRDEIITGPASQGGPQVRIFKMDGQVIGQFFAYLKTFRGGIDVSIGDLNNDKKPEIVVSVSNNGSPYIRVFNSELNLKYQFLTYDKSFSGGVNVAVADLAGDGAAEIIAGPNSNGGPQVRIFNIEGKALSQFFAYTKNFYGGVQVSAIRTSGD